MESIYYNTEDKEVAIILGYGIGSHLSLKYLEDVVNDIKELFPLLTLEQMQTMPFHEVAGSSKRHRYCWYIKFPYDLSNEIKDKYTVNINGITSAYPISSHKKGVNGWTYEDETAAEVMTRMIHD